MVRLRFFLSPNVAAGIRTVSGVEPTWDVLKDALPTELPRRSLLLKVASTVLFPKDRAYHGPHYWDLDNGCRNHMES